MIVGGDVNPLLLGPEGYQISRSVRLRSSATAYFNRTPASATNRTTWTYSGWAKRSNLGAWGTLFSSGVLGGTSSFEYITFRNDDTLQWVTYTTATQASLITTQVFRDPSAWYHIVVAFDSTQATASNRVKIYVNGAQVTSFSTATYPALNYSSFVNSNQIHAIGRDVSGDYLDGYLTEVNFIDGQALTPSSFGETDAVTGVWKPKKYTGTYGTNGFYLNFSDNSAATAAAIGKDYSGNGNNWTPNNISLTAGATYDSMIDVPTMWADGGNGRGNYCTLNPIDAQGTAGSIAAGNLNLTGGSAAWYQSRSGFGMTSGKWYWEVTILSTNAASNGIDIGIANASAQTAGVGLANQWIYNNNSSGRKSLNGTVSAYGSAFATNDIVGVAFDADAGTLEFYKNGTSQGVAASSGLPNPAFPLHAAYSTDSVAVNFGQRPFSYTPPTGFKALNTQNLPEPLIKKGTSYFNVGLYSGNGSTQNLTQLGFQPDFVWNKSRANTEFHVLMDSVRTPDKALYSNATNAEDSGLGNTFTSTGMNVVATGNINTSGISYVYWGWKKGATPGFDIVTYTGTGANRTVSHSLGVAPAMMIVKNRSAASTSWIVYHASLGATTAVYLDSTGASAPSSLYWNNTAPTSSVFTVGAYAPTNGSTNSLVAYLFAEVAGFSKMGSYTGNGSADGPFVYCGFRPRFILLKAVGATSAGNWYIYDTTREAYNQEITPLWPNLSNAEAGNTVYAIDALSNGFKIRTSASSINPASSETAIFAAFAENPFKNALAR